MDVETTGLDLRTDDILSIGIAHVVAGRLEPDSFYSLVQPRCEISAESAKVHSLTREEVATAPRVQQVMEAAKPHLREHLIVAHAAWIERAFLDRALRPDRERLPQAIVDTAALARAAGLDHGGDGEPGLEWLARVLGLPVHTPHHALGDAATTALVFLALVSRAEAKHGALTTGDLVRLSGRFAN